MKQKSMINTRIVILLGALFTIGACSNQTSKHAKPQMLQEYTPQQVLVAHDWRLTHLADKQIQLSDHEAQKVVGINFNSEQQRAAGFAGCNQFSGGYQVSESALSFQQMLSTQMACQQSDLELTYFKMLSKVQQYEIQGKVLKFFDADKKQLATFEINNKL